MDSLFVISLPRSLSSLIYQLASKAIGLRQPSWVSDGEIMNIDRFALYPGPKSDTSTKFVARHTSPKLFKAATDFLDQVAMRSGFAYKDVANPFVVSEWLISKKFRVLRIKRNIADVAYSMLEKEWHYPSVASHSQGDLATSVIEGLLQANQALDSVSGEDLSYDDFIYDEASTVIALSRLYPDREIEEFNYLNHSFSHVRDRILERRSTNIYKRLQEIVAERAAAINAASDGLNNVDMPIITNVKDVFRVYFRDRLLANPLLYKEINSCYKFIVIGDVASQWIMDITSPSYRIEEEHVSDDAQCLITISSKDLIDLVNGDLAIEFLLQFPGRLKIEGDERAATKLTLLLG